MSVGGKSKRAVAGEGETVGRTRSDNDGGETEERKEYFSCTREAPSKTVLFSSRIRRKPYFSNV